MAAREAQGSGVIDWGVAARPLEGEPRSGDTHAVVPLPGGALVAAVDGLGHGGAAADAAAQAAVALKEHAGQPLEQLMLRCHETMRSTRGAAVTLASFDVGKATLAGLGVGNVEGILVAGDGEPRRERILLRSGVVGYRLPRLRTSTVPVAPGDLLVMATDGVAGTFADEPITGGEQAPQAIAESLLGRFGKWSDDALVLVARYLGDGA